MSEVVDARTIKGRTYATLHDSVDSVDNGLLNLINMLLVDELQMIFDLGITRWHFTLGTMDDETGEFTPASTGSSKHMASGFADIKPYRFTMPANTDYSYEVYYYDENENYIGYEEQDDYGNYTVIYNNPEIAKFRVYVNTEGASQNSATSFLANSGIKVYAYAHNDYTEEEKAKLAEYPVATSSDEGKVLTVDSEGDIVWEEPVSSEYTLLQTEVLAEASDTIEKVFTACNSVLIWLSSSTANRTMSFYYMDDSSTTYTEFIHNKVIVTSDAMFELEKMATGLVRFDAIGANSSAFGRALEIQDKIKAIKMVCAAGTTLPAGTTIKIYGKN